MFKDNLKRLREEAKYTQEELAEKLFVSRSAVAKWEQGRGIPREETIEDIARIFNVPVSSFYGNNEPQKVIEKIEKKNKNVLFVTILVSIFILAFVIILTSTKKDYKIEYDKFFSEKTLKDYGLEYLRPITLNTKGSVNWNDNYYVNIASYDVFEEYVRYLFNYFKENPNIYYFGFGVERPLKSSSLLDKKTYVLELDSLEDYRSSIYYKYNENKSEDYLFYFIPRLDHNRNIGDKVYFNFIKLSYQHEISSWIKIKNVEYKTNAQISIHSTTNYGSGDYYLFEEYYDFEKIEINNNNFHDYFIVNCDTGNPGYSWYTINYKDKFYFRSYVPLTLEVGEGKNLESGKTILYAPSYGDYIKFINAYGYIDPVTNEIRYRYNVYVESGYIYRAKRK